MADIRLNNRLDVSLLRGSYDKRLIAAPPEEIQPNTTLAWHIDGAGSVSYNLSSSANGTGGPVRRFTLEWTLSPAGEVQCRARDAARSLRIVVEQRPDGALCTVAARHRRVPPPPRRGRTLSRLIPIAAGIVIVALLAGTLAALGLPTAHTPPTAVVSPALLVVTPARGGSVDCSARSIGYPGITVGNGGGATLHWQATVAGAGASITPASGTLTPGMSAPLAVRQPGPTKTAATVTLTSDGGNATLAFYCNGTPPPPPAPQLAVSPTQVATVICSGSSVPYSSITVRNAGGQTLTWQAHATVGGASVTPSSGSLGAGASRSLAVSQAGPTSTATNVTITSNGGNATVRFTCAPGPVHGNLAVNPTSLALGNYCGDSFSGVTITLSNTGKGSLTWSQSGGSGFALSPSGGQLKAGAKLLAAVSGTKSNSSFSIGWQDGGQGSIHTVTVSTTCTPRVVNFYIDPTSATYDCNSNPGAAAPPTSFTLNNTGSTVDVGWQITVNDPPNFYQDTGQHWASPSASQGVVPAGGTVQVTLTPNTYSVCSYLYSPYPDPFTVTVTLTSGGSGSFTFDYYILPEPCSQPCY